jgi:putative transposase
MPRTPRLVIPGYPLHVVQRGNNRGIIFRSPDDFRRFATLLLEHCRRFRCAIHAYVFMDNHVHILATPEDEHGPSRMMKAVGQYYASYVNATHSRTGTLWEGRFRSSLVDSERYLFMCSRYIELNPVRAGMTDDPAAYQWSSYRRNALGIADALVTPHALFQSLGLDDTEREASYRALFHDVVADDEIAAIRRAAKSGDLLGDDAFRCRAESLLGRSLARPEHGGDRRSARFRSTTLQAV